MIDNFCIRVSDENKLAARLGQHECIFSLYYWIAVMKTPLEKLMVIFIYSYVYATMIFLDFGWESG